MRIFKSILGAVSICLGTYFSLTIDNEFLKPIVFTIGILLVIYFDLNLITREIPLKSTPQIMSKRIPCNALIILTINLLTAYVIGAAANLQIAVKQPDFMNSVLAGIVIGLVSIIAKEGKSYKEIMILILMFCFVYLKLPHCVVWAFYGGLDPFYLPYICPIVAGNIVGGLIIGLIYQWLKKAKNNK